MEVELDHLKQHSLLQGLSDEHIRYLQKNSVQEKFLPNELIVEEGELSSDVYLILTGEINILKWDEEHCSQVLIGRLGKGETFGEMSFMDGSARSTTVKAAKPVTLLKLSKKTLLSVEEILRQIYANIALVNIDRLRTSNKVYVKNLQEHQHAFIIRQNIGKFLLYQYLSFGLIVAIGTIFAKNNALPLSWIIGLIPVLLSIRANRFTYAHFGVTFHHGISLICVSLATVAIVIVALISLNLIFQAYSLPRLMEGEERIRIGMWPFYALYTFAQEFIARGVMQTALKDFLQDDKGYFSLFINALFLFLFLLPLGIQPAFSLFLLGLPLGLLYLKQKSLIGIFIVHFLLLCLGILKT